MAKWFISADVPATVYQTVEADSRDEAFDKIDPDKWELSDDGLQPDGASEYSITKEEDGKQD